MSNYKSEHGQDKWLNDHIFKGRPGGFFVEAGAWDGITSSNTYFFEKELRWRGLLIEPDEESCAKISTNRSCGASNSLLWGEENTLDYISYHRKGLSGIKGIKSHVNYLLNVKKGTWDIKSMTATTLQNILAKNNCPSHMELLSLDVEGAEEFILKSFDFNLFSFEVILIETRQSNFDFCSFFGDKGYTKIHTIEGDSIFFNDKSRP
jgi:hypothetical protein